MPDRPDIPEEETLLLAKALHEHSASTLPWDDLEAHYQGPWLREARDLLDELAPALRKQGAEEERERLVADPIQVAFCHACGYMDDPRRGTCMNCGGQTQNLSKSLLDHATEKAKATVAEEERERLREALESKEALKAGEDVLQEAAAARPAWAGAVIAAVVNTVLPTPVSSEPDVPK